MLGVSIWNIVRYNVWTELHITTARKHDDTTSSHVRSISQQDITDPWAQPCSHPPASMPLVAFHALAAVLAKLRSAVRTGDVSPPRKRDDEGCLIVIAPHVFCEGTNAFRCMLRGKRTSRKIGDLFIRDDRRYTVRDKRDMGPLLACKSISIAFRRQLMAGSPSRSICRTSGSGVTPNGLNLRSPRLHQSSISQVTQACWLRGTRTIECLLGHPSIYGSIVSP